MQYFYDAVYLGAVVVLILAFAYSRSQYSTNKGIVIQYKHNANAKAPAKTEAGQAATKASPNAAAKTDGNSAG